MHFYLYYANSAIKDEDYKTNGDVYTDRAKPWHILSAQKYGTVCNVSSNMGSGFDEG